MKAELRADSVDEAEITDFVGGGRRGERVGIVGRSRAESTIDGEEEVKGGSYVDCGLTVPTRRERGWTWKVSSTDAIG